MDLDATRRRATASIRTVRTDDAADIAALLVELGYPGNGVDEVTERIHKSTDEATSEVLVAELDGRVVGVVALATTNYFERPGRWGRIVALVVDADFRRRGIARRLIEAAEELASKHGCVTMEVTSARSRTESHRCYRSLGYEEWCDRSARYLKDLEPGASAISYGARFPSGCRR